jgi:hypothetical protein
MNKSTYQPFSNTVRVLLMVTLAISLTLGAAQKAQAFASPAPVNLGAAAPFAILTETGISTTGTTAITGNLGVSPIDSTAITGFGLIADSTNTFSTSSLVTGKIYAANYAPPTPANMTTAVGDMQIAYADASSRAPDVTELGAGNISGLTIVPGVYKWSSGVLINTDVTLAGPANAVWIFEIADNLTVANGASVLLSGGAQASNVFWQVGGGVGVAIGSTAHVEGTILAAKGITLNTGATLNGRALAQTAVTLIANTVVLPLLAPTVVSVMCPTNPTNATTMNFTVTFSEPVTGVDAADFNLNVVGVSGASVGVVTGFGTTWTVPVNTGTGSGTIRLDVNSSGTGITNAANVPLSAGFTSGQTCTIDKTAPSVSSIVRVNADPTNLASVSFTVTFSKSVTGVDAADFNLTVTGLTGVSITGVSGTDAMRTVTVNTGSGNGTIRLDVNSSGTDIMDAVTNPLSGGFTGGQTYTVNKLPGVEIKTKVFTSNPILDGWVSESTKTKNVGGALNSTANTIMLGDNKANRQIRGILSFNTGTGLPDKAVITNVTLKVRKQGVTGGGNPVSDFQGFMVDIKRGAFDKPLLQVVDFQVAANNTYGPFSPSLTDSWYSLNLTNAKAYVNLLATNGSLTQIRLRFKLDGFHNGVANYLSLFSGNAGAANQPRLIIEYYVP